MPVLEALVPRLKGILPVKSTAAELRESVWVTQVYDTYLCPEAGLHYTGCKQLGITESLSTIPQCLTARLKDGKMEFRKWSIRPRDRATR